MRHTNVFRRLSVVAGAGALLTGAIIWSLTAGTSNLSAGATLQALLGQGSQASAFIVFELRLPRAAVGALVGLCLGLAGALTQAFARNPLATPDILGITSGAAVGAVAAIVLTGGSYATTSALLSLGAPALAGLGALLTAMAVYALAWRGGIDTYRLILVGIGLTATLTGLTNYLIVRAQLGQAANATQWLVGSLNGASWASAWPVAAALLMATPIALSQGRALDINQLGDELSTGLGVAMQQHRLLILGCAVALTAAAVAAAGPIAFVAFVAPQLATRLAGAARPPLIASALLGGVISVLADTAGRVLLPWAMPVGIVTAIIGAPWLIWLLTRRGERTAS